MNKCDHCGKEFTNERTILKHVCEPKRRFLQRNDHYVRLGFEAFKKFYETVQNAKPKTIEDYDQNRFYTAFNRYGRYCLHTKVIDVPGYTDWLIKNSVKIDDWNRDDVYSLFIKDYLRHENAEHAVTRSLNYMQKWADQNNCEFNEYFKNISPNLALHDIANGHVSPWLVLNTASGLELLDKFTDEQLAYVNSVLDPQFWAIKFKRVPAEMEYVKSVLEAANL
jgi:hypothetical protein